MVMFGILYEDPTDPLPKNSCSFWFHLFKFKRKTIILTIILIMEAKYMIVELIVKQKTLLLSA